MLFFASVGMLRIYFGFVQFKSLESRMSHLNLTKNISLLILNCKFVKMNRPNIHV